MPVRARKVGSEQAKLKSSTDLTAKRAGLLVDKNSRAIVKLSQLLEIYNQRGASELDDKGRVAHVIDRYKQRITRRLARLAKFVDTPEHERPREKPPLLFLPKKKVPAPSRRKSRPPPPPPRPRPAYRPSLGPSTDHPSPSNVNQPMTAESERQYSFGWKRYVEFCELKKLNPNARDKVASTQVLNFAQYLMDITGKGMKPSAANSYVSAVGRKLVDAKLVESMRDVRTPQMRELFATSDTTRRKSFGRSSDMEMNGNKVVGHNSELGNVKTLNKATLQN